jgi:hypothetical protein
MLPSVTMTGLIRSTSIRTALSAPAPAPTASAQTIAIGPVNPDTSATPAATEDARTTEPTDKRKDDRADGQVDSADEYDDHHPEPEKKDGRHLAENILDVGERAEYRRSHGKYEEKDGGRGEHRLPGKEAGRGICK